MIKEIEDALIALCEDCLEPRVDVGSGPGEFDGAYLKELIPSLPAVRVVWHGGTVADETALTLFGAWSIYVVTGWAGETQKERRRGTGAAYAITETLAIALQNIKLKTPTGSTLGRAVIEQINNLWSGQWDRVGVAVYDIVLEIDMPMDFRPVDLKSALDDWLRVGVGFDLDGDGDSDLDGDFDLPT